MATTPGEATALPPTDEQDGKSEVNATLNSVEDKLETSGRGSDEGKNEKKGDDDDARPDEAEKAVDESAASELIERKDVDEVEAPITRDPPRSGAKQEVKDENDKENAALDGVSAGNEAPPSPATVSRHALAHLPSSPVAPRAAGASQTPGVIHAQTPIPNSDSALRLLRKFSTKTGPFIPESHGGTMSRGFLAMIFGSSTSTSEEDPCLSAYLTLMESLVDTHDSADAAENPEPIGARASEVQPPLQESDIVVESILGGEGDTMRKARLATAAFVHLLSVWAHESAITDVSSDKKRNSVVTPNVLRLAIDSAERLVAHGCLDGVLIAVSSDKITFQDGNDGAASGTRGHETKDAELDGVGDGADDGTTYVKGVHLLAESVFLCDLSSEETELAALKFLLTTGCRTSTSTASSSVGTVDAVGEAMLHGTHLLQTIRVCYHVYLKTTSEPNKVTARAALRQLVASTFKRMERRAAHLVVASLAAVLPIPGPEENGKSASQASSAGREPLDGVGDGAGSFASNDHRDAYLVLRSLCKLSMRALPDIARAYRSEDGRATVPSRSQHGASISNGGDVSSNGDSVLSTGVAINNPALESKILALELLLYILQNTSTSTLANSGPQFLYAVRHYLCVSLLKNCTSDNTIVVNLSLRLFVPLIQHFRASLKTEIEAFITNVFFVILDSENTSMEHKSLVVTLFEEICSDSATLAEFFLNYDCDLSAVDLFNRIVNTLAKVARVGLSDKDLGAASIFVAGAGAVRAERERHEQRELRLDAMKALRQVLASLHGSIVSPTGGVDGEEEDEEEIGAATEDAERALVKSNSDVGGDVPPEEPQHSGTNGTTGSSSKDSLVKLYDSKKKRREEESEAILKFNQKPSAGLSYLSKCGHIDGSDPVDVAQYLLKNKDVLDKTQIGEYLGREATYQDGFALKVLHAYVQQLNFEGLLFDDAIRYYLSSFRLPGEAQKIDRIMEKFAERYTLQNPSVFPSADVAFILAFSVIMLQTDLHNPAIKEERKMTKEGFIRNNRGICDGGDLPSEFLEAIFDRVKETPFSLKEDDEARERVDGADTGKKRVGLQTALSPSVFFGSHYVELDRTRESNFQKERDQIVRDTESLLRRKKRSNHPSRPPSSGNAPGSVGLIKFVRTEDTGLRDEYVTPMFDVAWAPTLAVFSTVMESANGTLGALAAVASDEELEMAADNAASAMEVCLSAFQMAICTAGLCGNDTARGAFVHALANFSLLGTGRLLEYRHVRCAQALLQIGRDDGELLGDTWEHVFRSMSEIARLHRLFELLARNDRRLEALEEKRRALAERARNEEDGAKDNAEDEFDDEDDFEDEEELLEEEMDKRAIDEANARLVHEAISQDMLDAIYLRSSSMSDRSVKEFVYQLCRVSRMEIAGYGGHVGSSANSVDLTAVHYRQQHTLLTNRSLDGTTQPHHNQPDIHSMQKLVEVAHYNMDSRPRLVFADLWSTISVHLTSTALHSNPAVAMYAVDSFRQLGIQFLQREELGVFEFQRRFLKPFETVMAKCEHSEVKELLLRSIEQIIQLFGADDSESTRSSKRSARPLQDNLMSGWRPVLAVLGLTAKDESDTIAETGFKLLTAQLTKCVKVEKPANSMRAAARPKLQRTASNSLAVRADRFVDLVDAVLMFVSGEREEMSLAALDHLITLSNYLADDNIPLPEPRRKSLGGTPRNDGLNASGILTENEDEELEVWWPILLGLSRVVGEERQQVRVKSLVTLFAIINQHFFPSAVGKKGPTANLEESEGEIAEGAVPRHGELQTLQLIFRGVLTPTLEHAEPYMFVGTFGEPPVPDGFSRFLTKPTPAKSRRSVTEADPGGALDGDTTFSHLMDGCTALCLRSMDVFNTDSLVEEVLAMVNSCLVADSGRLAVSGLLRLHTFITKDLRLELMSDNTWATVCHMLRRCLTVRGLPSEESPVQGEDEAVAAEDENRQGEEVAAMMSEFVLEEEMMAERRYIGGNAVMVIGSLLSQHSDYLGLEWSLFLVSGLAKAVAEWERAAEIMALYPRQNLIEQEGPEAPHYLENALFGRKWAVKMLLALIARDDVLVVEAGKDISAESRQSLISVRSAIKEQTEDLLRSYLKRESALSGSDSSGTVSLEARGAELKLLCKTVRELLEGFNKLDDAKLFSLASLTPTFSACMQSTDKTARDVANSIVQKMFQGPLSEKVDAE